MTTKIVIYVLDLSLKGNLYNKIKLNISDVVSDFNNNIIEIQIKKTPLLVTDKFIEEIELFNDVTNERTGIYYFSLYINEINKLFCQINVKGDYLFEIINYNNYYNRLPPNFEFIKEDNKKIELNEFDRFGLKNVQRITLLNIKKKQINSKISNMHLATKNGSGSYLISKITIDKKEIIRLHRIRREKYNNDIDLDISQFEKYINDIYNYIEKIIITPNKIKDNLISKFDKNPLSEQFIKKVKNIRDCVRFNTKYKFKLNELHYKSSLIYIVYKLNKKANGDYFAILCKSNEIKDEVNLSWSCKINILFAYNQMRKSPPDNNFIEPELIILKNCLDGCAYANAFKLLKDIINNITSDSKLFTYFYLCNSGSGCNRLFKNVISFKLSMLSENMIKDHLEKLLPEAIFRYSYIKSNGYGLVLKKDGVMVINDGKIFNQDSDIKLKELLLENQDKEYKYSIPLLMSFLHELFDHRKNMFKNKDSSSPTHINSINKFNFNPKINEVCFEEGLLNDYYISTSGENLRTLEFFISNNINDIYALKFSCIPFKELSSYKIWIEKDFSNLIKIVNEKTKDFKFDYKKHSLSYFPKLIFEGELEKVNEEEIFEYWSDKDYDNEDHKLDKIKSKIKKKNKIKWKF